ncbi:MAG: inositol monophosphatase [bacterium]|nr:inositol monophosphatase [bacterium]
METDIFDAGNLALENLMIAWCEEAADIARTHYRNTGDLVTKQGSEVVTDVDLTIETLLRQRIGREFPDDLIVGEEFGGPSEDSDDSVDPENPGTSANISPGKRTWQIDPIDGTLNYALGSPNYCISLAVMWNNEVLAACVLQPSTRDCFSATLRFGARLNGQSMNGPSKRTLNQAIVCYQIRQGSEIMGNSQRMHQLLKAPLKIRRAGAIALEMAWTAAGFYDLLVMSFPGKINTWDVAAGLLLVSESGGVVVDFENRPYLLEGPDMVVGSPIVAEEIMMIVQGPSV